jgi:hypothetical protein
LEMIDEPMKSFASLREFINSFDICKASM